MKVGAFEKYLSASWRMHSAMPAQVIGDFELGFEHLQGTGQCRLKLPDFANLVEHTTLAHCRNPNETTRWLSRLRSLEGTESEPAATSLARMEFAISVSAGILGPLPMIADDQALSACANGLLANCTNEGPDIAMAWIAMFYDDLPTSTRSRAKALAGSMNCLSLHLSKLKRVDGVRDVMIAAATLSRDARAHLDNWRALAEAERFLSLTYSGLGDGRRAVDSAMRCRALCTSNDAQPSACFLASHALAKALVILGEEAAARLAVHDMHEQLKQTDNPSIRSDLAALLLEVDATLEAQATASSLKLSGDAFSSWRVPAREARPERRL